MHEGDRVLFCWASANHDESVFDDPETVKLDRSPNRHAAFGFGAHRCICDGFARGAEFGVILKEVLIRLPDFKVDVPAVERFPSVGAISGFISMPATFTPGERSTSNTDLASLWEALD
jgi:cytochrome P450